MSWFGRQVGVIRFASSASVDAPLSADVPSVLDLIEGLDTSNGGGTSIDSGLQTYQTMVSSDGQPGAVRLAVLLSDGVPNDFDLANAEVRRAWSLWRAG